MTSQASEALPAWSEPFTPPTNKGLARLPALDSITREWAWGGSTGEGVSVAIVDSGVEGDHPWVKGRLVESVAVEMHGDEPEIVETEPVDLFGHGTACAGIIVGLAPDVEIVSVRVLGADLRGKGASFAAGLQYVIERPVAVANLSLSSKSEAMQPFFYELADEAYFRRVVLVSAANNVVGPSYPSLFSSVISVAAHSEPDPWRFYYNPNPPVEFGAWGLDVPVAWMNGGETLVTGNSFAAPHITAIVALILAKHPGLTTFEVKSILAAVADNERPGADGGGATRRKAGTRAPRGSAR
ncbi:MAG TPA: S8 family serine peptidase [Candidatus Limnocylindria bacterium]|nr:S8 family serine peptidase [Candidatus Limnocylindria bacterium]